MAVKPLAIIAGVGAGTGASVAKRFAAAYTTILLARNPANLDPVVEEITSAGGEALGIPTDISDPASVRAAFEQVQNKYGGVDVGAAIYNASSWVKKPFLEISLEEWEGAWSVGGRGAFLFSSSVLPLLLQTAKNSPTYPPTLIFTGATASVKASPQFAAFASPKWAQRALSQSLAKEFGPQGIHVAHAIIDGVIDIPRTKEWLKGAGPEAKISSDAIADAYWNLHTQPRSCFTWEIDIRPWVEKW